MNIDLVYYGWARGSSSEVDCIYIGDYYHPISKQVMEDIDFSGDETFNLSIRLGIHNEPFDFEDVDTAILEYFDTDEGPGLFQFDHHYSEVTGYLWTDEEFTIGALDVIGKIEKYLLPYYENKKVYVGIQIRGIRES